MGLLSVRVLGDHDLDPFEPRLGDVPEGLPERESEPWRRGEQEPGAGDAGCALGHASPQPRGVVDRSLWLQGPLGNRRSQPTILTE